jgi:peptidoglycan-N-acetylglucosamine deacetylase
MFYTIKTPWLFKKIIYPSLMWEKPTKEKILYLTFDDGPHQTATPFVLDQLKQHNARATFFCIGKNVVEQQNLYRRIMDEGHKVGNHTFNHLNGWKTNNKTYMENISKAAKYIDSNLFRPPYGRITKFQASLLQGEIGEWSAGDKKKDNKQSSSFTIHHSPFTIVMWTILSGDFDEKISPERCLQNVILHSKPGSIIVFHDSSKAWNRMSFALPRVLEYFSKQDFRFKTL